MTDKERIEQLEIYLTELLVRQEENSARLQQNTERLDLMEARLDKIVAILGILPQELDVTQDIWLQAPLIIRQMQLRQN